MIARLKEETRELHERVEKKNLAGRIMDHSIDLDTYKLLLMQNYIAYSKTETEIQQFLPHYQGIKHQQLKHDLKQLGISEMPVSKNDIFECQSRAEALGAAYVVEGSALGGMVLARNISKCPGLESVSRHFFFNGDKGNLQAWQAFKEELEGYTFTPDEEREAIEKARETFRFFECIFDRQYELH